MRTALRCTVELALKPTEPLHRLVDSTAVILEDDLRVRRLEAKLLEPRLIPQRSELIWKDLSSGSGRATGKSLAVLKATGVREARRYST